MSEERLISDEYTPWSGEHFHRYNIAESYVKRGDVVLDIATGTGYGSHQLSLVTHGKVIGGDISTEAIESCKKKWPSRENLSFQVMDGSSIPFPDNYFDKVVSFETIEHTTKYDDMLKEFRRIVKPDGIIFISTPNILINSPGGVVINKYHTHEFTYEELEELLNKHYLSVTILGQFYNRYHIAKGIKHKLAFIMEKIFFARGIRKIPLSVRDKFMKLLIQKRLYPQPDDYILTNNIDKIKRCRTFFAICKVQ